MQIYSLVFLGWKWVKFCEAKHPTFWVCQDGCKSRCGAALAGYSHCQPNSDATHSVVNGTQSNGTINGITRDKYWYTLANTVKTTHMCTPHTHLNVHIYHTLALIHFVHAHTSIGL